MPTWRCDGCGGRWSKEPVGHDCGDSLLGFIVGQVVVLVIIAALVFIVRSFT
jgi:hypothetical protein